MLVLLLRLTLTAVVLPLLVLVQVAPPLLHVFAWLTRYLFALLFVLTRWSPSHGPLVLLAAGLWIGVALLLLPWFQLILPPATAFWLLVVAGGLWGLCVGHQAALLWQAEVLRLPDTDTEMLFDLPPDHFQSEPDDRAGQASDDRLDPGIILGHTDDFADLYDEERRP